MSESVNDIIKRRQKEFDTKEEKTVIPESLKSPAEKLIECRETVAVYQSIVMDQETKLVDLQAEACLRANEFRTLQKENQDLCDRLSSYETERR